MPMLPTCYPCSLSSTSCLYFKESLLFVFLLCAPSWIVSCHCEPCADWNIPWLAAAPSAAAPAEQGGMGAASPRGHVKGDLSATGQPSTSAPGAAWLCALSCGYAQANPQPPTAFCVCFAAWWCILLGVKIVHNHQGKLVAGGPAGSLAGQLPGTRKPEALSEEARRVLMGCLTELHKTTSLYSMDELRQVPCQVLISHLTHCIITPGRLRTSERRRGP